MVATVHREHGGREAQIWVLSCFIFAFKGAELSSANKSKGKMAQN